jgi:PhnB protein
MNVLGPKSIGGTAVTLSVYVDDVDATFARAIAAGAKEMKRRAAELFGS